MINVGELVQYKRNIIHHKYWPNCPTTWEERMHGIMFLHSVHQQWWANVDMSNEITVKAMIPDYKKTEFLVLELKTIQHSNSPLKTIRDKSNKTYAQLLQPQTKQIIWVCASELEPFVLKSHYSELISELKGKYLSNR